jgi:hypothetical protein
MYKVLFLLCLILSIAACNSPVQPTDPDKHFSDSLWNVISGEWGGETGGAVWKIKKDSITYSEEDKVYPCWLKKDTFSLKFPDRDTATVFGRMSVSGDTLKIVSWWDDGSKYTTFAYRVK